MRWFCSKPSVCRPATVVGIVCRFFVWLFVGPYGPYKVNGGYVFPCTTTSTLILSRPLTAVGFHGSHAAQTNIWLQAQIWIRPVQKYFCILSVVLAVEKWVVCNRYQLHSPGPISKKRRRDKKLQVQLCILLYSFGDEAKLRVCRQQGR